MCEQKYSNTYGEMFILFHFSLPQLLSKLVQVSLFKKTQMEWHMSQVGLLRSKF